MFEFLFRAFIAILIIAIGVVLLSNVSSCVKEKVDSAKTSTKKALDKF